MNRLRLFILFLVAVLAGCAGTSRQYATEDNKVFVATDTSRTIDLTHPPRDMWDRIRRGFAVPNLQSDLTEQWTMYYASHPESVYQMSQRASRYLYFIVDELERRGLPSELALLPFVESAYNPTAYSRSHASGLWQFIPSTGRYYNLQQDSWRDQRRDPIASTHAALDYLSYLYDFQGDWYLALASYNWGEGAVKRALERNAQSGLPLDYISLSMPDETRNYVPKLQAIKNIIANPKKFGLKLPHVANAPYFTTVHRSPTMEVETAAQLAEMSVEEFKLLNASFNRPVILAEHNATLLVPAEKAEVFHENLKAYQAQGALNTWQTYQARKGESFAAIAKKFGVTLAALRKVNGLSTKGSKTIENTILVIPHKEANPVQLASLEYPAASPSISGARSSSQPSAASSTAQKTSARRSSRTSDVVVVKGKGNVRTHTVKKGETLFGLAKRYNTSVAELRQLNNLRGDKLALGTRLRIPGTNVRG